MTYTSLHLQESQMILQGIDDKKIEEMIEILAKIKRDGGRLFVLGVFVGSLKVSRLSVKDCIFILSVGGGDFEKKISLNLCAAIDFAKEVGAKVIGIVGKENGYTHKMADVCLVIPTVNPATITPHSESFQAVVWHLMVSHPLLKENPTKW